MSSLSLVVPCYNEEKNIERFILDWHAELSRKLNNFEIIAVDDCSTDSTPQILKRLAGQFPRVIVLANEENKKYGETIAKGIRHASEDYVIWADSDYSHKPEDIWKLWKYRNDYDAVWGVRGITQRDSWGRVVFTTGNVLLILVFFHIYLRDPNCAFKLYRRKNLLRILDTISIHPIMTTTKIAIRTKQMKYSTKEVPVEFLKRSLGSGSINDIQAVFVGIKEMLHFKAKSR